MVNRLSRFGAALFCAAGLGVVPAHAQTSGLSRQEMNPAGRSATLAPTPDLFSAPAPGECPLAENPAPLTITSVTLRGLTAVPADALKPAYARYLGLKGDAADLCRVRDAIGEALFRRGILARVEIPAQTINDGAVVIEVIEARIDKVTLRGDPGEATPLLERYADQLRGMTPFDINKVQRYILLASDVPGLKVRASVRPGASGARGAVDLDLTVQHDDEELTVNAQNLQSTATGRWGVLARYDLNDRNGAGARTTLVGYRTLANEQWVVQGLEEMRLGSHGLTARAAVAYGESHPDVGGSLPLKNVSLVANFEAAYPLIRRRRENLSFVSGLEIVNQETRIAGARLIDDQLRVVHASFEGDRTGYWFGHPTVLRGTLGVRRGIKGFGATSEGDPLLSRAAAQPAGWSLSAGGSLMTVLTPRLAFYGQVQGQYANQPLAVYEEYAVGGLTIGRGYDPGYVSGDQAIAASAALRAGPFQPIAGWAVSPYVWFDAASTHDKDPGGQTQTLTSAGFGVQIPLRDRWVVDIGYAHPFDRRAGDRKDPPDRLLINLTTRFF